MKKLMLIPLLACAGCFQILRFTDGGAYYNYPRSSSRAGHPYRATKEIWNDWFCAPAKVYGWWGMHSYDPIGDAWLTIMWPFSLIDLPCEVVFDTVMCVPDWILAKPDPSKQKAPTPESPLQAPRE